MQCSYQIGIIGQRHGTAKEKEYATQLSDQDHRPNNDSGAREGQKIRVRFVVERIEFRIMMQRSLKQAGEVIKNQENNWYCGNE